jgi:hypothetical protein
MLASALALVSASALALASILSMSLLPFASAVSATRSKEFVGPFQQQCTARSTRIARLNLIGNSAVTIRDYGTIVHKRKLVLELTQGGFPTNRPPRWLALYSYLQFYWEGNLVAPLIAAPNGECTNEKTKDRAEKLDYRLCM